MTLRLVSLSSPAPYPLTILFPRLLGDRAITILCSIQRVVQITVVGLLIFAGTLSLAAESPTEVVRTTINDVIRVLEDKELKAPAKLLSRRHLLEDVIAQRFDYAEMSKRALAANWTPLTNKQRDEFVELFKAFLSDRYAAKIEGYSGEQVEYLNERVDGQFAEVRTKLVSSKVEIPMDYRLINKAGRWYAYDIIVDGVSLVKNYRSQFASIIRSSSYEELVHRLRNRTVEERHTG
jgi:phospholipid transport system substrate-binding protein